MPQEPSCYNQSAKEKGKGVADAEEFGREVKNREVTDLPKRGITGSSTPDHQRKITKKCDST